MTDTERPPSAIPAPGVRRLPRLDRQDAAFAAAALAGSLALQFSFDRIVGSDGFFHVRAAERVFGGGMPWLPLTVFADGWVDHQLLFHAAMAPFATLLDGLVAAKAAAATFAALAIFALWRFLRTEGCPAPAAFALLPGALSWMFLLRMEMPRTQSLSLALLVASLGALGRGRHLLLFGLAWIYAWTYHVSVILLPVALLHAAVVATTSRTAPVQTLWRGPAAAAAGLLAGFAIHPHSPRTFRFLWQHVVEKVGNREALPVGLEWTDGGLTALLGSRGEGLLVGGLGAVALALALAALVRAGPRRSAQAVFVAILAGGATAALFVGTKFVEYSVPLSALALALALRDLDVAPRRAARVGAGVAVAAMVAVNAWTVRGNVLDTEPHPAEAEAGAAWLAAHVPAGELVFHFHWNDFPELVYWAPQYRYVAGLDPHFLYLADPDLWREYESLGGVYPGLRSQAISQRFGARWAVVRLPHPGAREALASDPGLIPTFDDGFVLIYEVDPPN